MICLCSDALLEAREGTKVNSAPKLTAEKPSSTPEMDAHQAEEMANSMMCNSPLPEAEKSDERLPKEDGAGCFRKREEARSFLKRSP